MMNIIQAHVIHSEINRPAQVAPENYTHTGRHFACYFYY